MSDRRNREKEANIAVFEALGHPVRRRVVGVMLDMTASATHSPRALARSLGLPLSNVAYHVRVLVNCGVLELQNAEPVCGSIQHFYSVSPRFSAMAPIADLLKEPPADGP